MADDSAVVAVRFEGEDFELLKALVDKERLSRSDVIRRAVRAYAETLGVSVTKKRKR